MTQDKNETLERKMVVDYSDQFLRSRDSVPANIRDLRGKKKT